MSSIRVVFSMDLARTRVLGVMGELASLSGLKFITALRIRLDVEGLVRMRTDRQFSVPSTTRASLHHGSLVSILNDTQPRVVPYLLLSCSTTSMRSRRPVASASSCLVSRNGWSAGIIPKDTSRPLRCSESTNRTWPQSHLVISHLVQIHGCRLCEDHALGELDAAELYCRGSIVPYPQDSLLDGHQFVPGPTLVRIMCTKKSKSVNRH